MIIRKYGLVLERLKEKDIELIRHKRNSEAIQQNMYYKGHITPLMQKEWFKAVNNKYNGYFIIIYRGKKIGMLNGKNVDFDERTCEGGIFIWDKKYLSSEIPSLASLIMNDWTFLLGNFKAIYAKVLKKNKTAISYNSQQGYTICEPQNNDKQVVWMKITKESYLKKTEAVRKNIARLTHDKKPLNIENLDASDDLGKEIGLFYKGLPPDIQAIANKLIAKAKKKRRLKKQQNILFNKNLNKHKIWD